ncbi:hypothetical protein FPSE_05902 [Fusarium pseudograminearum CS3096]|uniref:RING-type domain-containing protein n=1 Tax=Fusarium pseudograminearum (strain CS3096) TaxID=1028729 RepID=K3UNT4_FUSPC|nr:hypothetical protein FPSE_05902 [Fusarium pseudograminearum CS3096]EKJ73941.1 hypothetical protein FPSE_05902 [Fusarium pseudograminearum CS3096]
MAHQSPPRRRYLQTRARAESITQSQQTSTKSTPGSWIKSKILPWIAPWFQPHRSYDPEESFIPFPKVTFLVDKPIKIQCQICHQANCQIKPDAEPPDESQFSLMPCGHAACSNCLEQWFKTQKTCPFCRANLVYGCGHAVPPRPLTEEGLHMIPKTLPDRGCIPNFCVHCRKAIQMEEAKDKFRQAVEEFEAARQRFSQTQAAADELIMLSKRDEFETVYQDVHLNLLRTWLTRW